MRKIVLCLGAVALIAATSAAAQQQSRWNDPTGQWSIDFVSSGWGHAEGLPANGPALLTIPMQPPPDNETRMCIVEQSAEPLAAGADAAQVRGRGAQMNVADAERAFPRMQLTQATVDHTVIDGVGVAVVNGMSRENRFRGRAFVTIANGAATTSTISCISTPHMASAPDAEINSILASLHFDGAAKDAAAAAPAVNSSALDAQLTETLAIYDEICFRNFPDDAAVARAMSARHAEQLSAAETRRYLHDDPGVAWSLTGQTGRFVITVEQPPYHACGIRTMTAAGFPSLQKYDEFVTQHRAGRTLNRVGPIDTVMGGTRTHGWGEQVLGANGAAEGYLAFVSTPASPTNDPLPAEVRFVRQIVVPQNASRGTM